MNFNRFAQDKLIEARIEYDDAQTLGDDLFTLFTSEYNRNVNYTDERYDKEFNVSDITEFQQVSKPLFIRTVLHNKINILFCSGEYRYDFQDLRSRSSSHPSINVGTVNYNRDINTLCYFMSTGPKRLNEYLPSDIMSNIFLDYSFNFMHRTWYEFNENVNRNTFKIIADNLLLGIDFF